MAKPHVLILGAGPAGLGAALQLTRRSLARVTVFERNHEVGGNAGSFELAGMFVDYGSRRLHPSCNVQVLRDIRALLGPDLLKRQRHGRIRLRGCWIHFPLKPLDLALRLPPTFALGVGTHLLGKVVGLRQGPPAVETFLARTLAGFPAHLRNACRRRLKRHCSGTEPSGMLILLKRLPIWKSTIQHSDSLLERNRSLHVVILLAILLIASALRLHRLDQGLWYDEILTYIHYAQLPFGEIITTYNDQNNHILYSILAHIALVIFGESPWSLRLPAAVFGVGSIWALYLLGRQVTNAREALLSAALLTFSYHHIWFSQNARGYTGLLFWTIFSSWLFLRGMRETRPHLWLLYAVAVAMGVYTHMTMLFVATGHFFIYVIALLTRPKEIWPDRWSGLFRGFCLAGCLTLVLYALVLPQLFGGTLGQGAEQSAAVTVWKNPVWTLVELVKGLEIGFAGSIAGVIAVSVCGAGLMSFMHTNPVLVGLLVIPAVIASTALIGAGHPLWPRVFFFTIGFGALIAIRGTTRLGYLLTRLAKLPSAKSALIGIIISCGLIVLSAMSVPLAYGPKQDYLGALTYVEERYEPGDVIVTVGVVAAFPYKNLYGRDWEAVETLQELDSVRGHAKRTWVLYTMPVHAESIYPEIMASIRSDFKVEKQFYGTVGGGTITVCRSDVSASY